MKRAPESRWLGGEDGGSGTEPGALAKAMRSQELKLKETDRGRFPLLWLQVSSVIKAVIAWTPFAESSLCFFTYSLFHYSYIHTWATLVTVVAR